jgi:hypothetical protein
MPKRSLSVSLLFTAFEFLSEGFERTLPAFQAKVPPMPHAFLTKRVKADTNYLIDQQRLEV